MCSQRRPIKQEQPISIKEALILWGSSKALHLLAVNNVELRNTI